MCLVVALCSETVLRSPFSCWRLYVLCPCDDAKTSDSVLAFLQFHPSVFSLCPLCLYVFVLRWLRSIDYGMYGCLVCIGSLCRRVDVAVCTCMLSPALSLLSHSLCCVVCT